MSRHFIKITLTTLWYLLLANTTFAYTRQDSLRGSNGPGRNWWDVERYELQVAFDTADKSIQGKNKMTFTVTGSSSDIMQIDLQDSLTLDEAKLYIKRTGELIPNQYTTISSTKEGNVWWLRYPFSELNRDSAYTLELSYHGKPRIAKLPPWDGGFIWTKDSTGNPWISVACQGLGASAWWPCKDYQGDEPDSGMLVSYAVPIGVKAIGNGKLIAQWRHQSGQDVYTWEIRNPINTYDVSFYIGNYTNWADTIKGEKRILGLDFNSLSYNEEKARKHFAVAKEMLHCFEYWMGPYPFYEDGYKLVEAPFLGMEHQSAVAYGNEYKMGYRGHDRSNTGVGLLFDFIIVHESGHEWFGNNITAKDIADNWIHEGFTTYTEALFAECAFGKEKAFAYTRGEWKNIRNDKPVIGTYGVQDDGSGDKYDKGSAVVHMIRMMMNNDEKFRQLLRGLNKDFYHKTVTEQEFEEYIIKFTGINLKPLFNQYLRTADIPVVEWYIRKKHLNFRFTKTVKDFTLPLEVSGGRRKETIHPTTEWQSISWKKGGYNVSFSEDFLITTQP